MADKPSYLDTARRVISTEARALEQLGDGLGDEFDKAVEVADLLQRRLEIGADVVAQRLQRRSHGFERAELTHLLAAADHPARSTQQHRFRAVRSSKATSTERGSHCGRCRCRPRPQKSSPCLWKREDLNYRIEFQPLQVVVLIRRRWIQTRSRTRLLLLPFSLM